MTPPSIMDAVDGAGEVAAAGPDVTQFRVGDRVYAAAMPLQRPGCYAEYAAVDADFVAHVPVQVPTDQAGAMPWDALTAMTGLELLELQPQQRLMVLGASGGVGHLAVQLAQRWGVRVLAVASGEDGVRLVRRLGAAAAVDGRAKDLAAAAGRFAPDGIDAALITVGGTPGAIALSALEEAGRAAIPNGVEPVPSGHRPIRPIFYDGDRSPGGTARLNAAISAGPFSVHLGRTFPRAQAARAHRALTTHYLGKLALIDNSVPQETDTQRTRKELHGEDHLDPVHRSRRCRRD